MHGGRLLCGPGRLSDEDRLFDRGLCGRGRRLDSREERDDENPRTDAGYETGENFPLDLQRSSSSIASGFASA
jgi:hypothetical protein